MNWKVFDLKYDNREQWAFEQMSYLLFCAEFDNRVGLFRYKNQVGIETEPIEKDGTFYSFQAKYYSTPISKNKSDIIDSIQKAKNENDKLNAIYLYTNQELSESKKAKKKKPIYQIEIEEAAQTIDLDIIWRVPSHIELQLSLPENKYIHDIFFNLEPHAGDLIDEVSKHNENILRAIQTEIYFGDKSITIDRNQIAKKVLEGLYNNTDIIISGEGGCGKTAVFKQLYNLHVKNIPFCVFKATEVNVTHINDLFQFDHKFSFEQFLQAYKNELIKVFVIDSAEKLAEIIDNNILNDLLHKLKDAGWNILFTTRYSYLNDLTFHIRENYKLSFNVINVPLIEHGQLTELSIQLEFGLPRNPKFSERLRNLFYLNEYSKFYPNINQNGSFKDFINLVWKKRIQNNLIQKNNLHIEREKCIIKLAKERCKTGRFYINGDALPQNALFELKQDEIIGYNEAHDGYFITHDIYEEWALDKVVLRSYANHSQ